MNLRIRVAAAATATAIALALVAAPVLAQTVTPFPCGRVAAYTPPTATSAGSITLGTNTFVLAMGSVPNPPPIAVGSISCLAGERDASGAFLLRATLVGDTVCGVVAAFTPASASAPGSLTLRHSILVAPGVSLSSAQVTGSHCYRFGFNAEGNAQVVGYVGSVPLRQSPSTSTSSAPDQLGVVLVLLVAASALVVGSRGAWTRSS